MLTGDNNLIFQLLVKIKLENNRYYRLHWHNYIFAAQQIASYFTLILCIISKEHPQNGRTTMYCKIMKCRAVLRGIEASLHSRRQKM